MKKLFFLTAILVISLISNGQNTNDGWIELINGKDFTGWRASENQGTWRVIDGMFEAHGKRSHLFYEGEHLGDGFKNFELEVQVKTFKLANSGIYIHTAYQESGWPNNGIEIQVNNSHVGEGDYLELKKMASLYGVRNVYKGFGADDRWLTLKARVESNHVQIWVDGVKTVDYIEPEQTPKGVKRLSKGTFCLQGHDVLSKMQYKSFKVRRLPDDAVSTLPAPKMAAWKDSLVSYQARQIAFIDLNPKGSLDAKALAAYTYATGINVALVKTPEKSAELVTAKGLPLFQGIQVNASNKNAALKTADYKIGVSTTLNTARELLASGKIQVWSDKGKNLNMETAPELLRMANQNSVAIEIDNEAMHPSIEVLKMVKEHGIRITFTGLIPESKMDKSGYVFQALREVGFTYKDQYIPQW